MRTFVTALFFVCFATFATAQTTPTPTTPAPTASQPTSTVASQPVSAPASASAPVAPAPVAPAPAATPAPAEPAVAVADESIVDILKHSSLPALIIMGIVAFLGIVSISLGFERLLYFRNTDSDSNAFIEKAAPLLKQGKLEEVVATAKQHTKGHLPRIVKVSIEAFLEAQSKGVDPVDLANRAAEREINACSDEMRAWTSIMGTTGSTSPFIGLLGTVVGIIVTFQDIKKQGNASLGTVSGGISEALIATAIGLVAAIPAVMLFNYFAGRADALTAKLTASGAEVIDTCRLHRLGEKPAAKKQEKA